MQYVIDVEGISFISAGSYNDQVQLTDEERVELGKFETEIMTSERPILAEEEGYKGDNFTQEE